jgi:hypothetical protein
MTNEEAANILLGPARPAAVGPPDLRALLQIFAEMKAANDLVDAASGTRMYGGQLVALAILTRQFLPELEALLSSEPAGKGKP